MHRLSQDTHEEEMDDVDEESLKVKKEEVKAADVVVEKSGQQVQ